jgi:alcohol dehydrogenase class IV
MVKSFNFSKLPSIYFGPGKLSVLPGVAKKYGESVLLATGEKSFTATGKSQIIDSLKAGGFDIITIKIIREPSPDDIDNEARSLRDKKIDLVIGIGGGSVMDAAKAISAMLYKDESVADFLEGVGNKEHPGTKVPFIAVPTTSGTGSEATKNSVLSKVGEKGYKRSLRHDNLVPDVAIVDPELTLTCPPVITAASGMDCFTQITEAFLSDKANEFSDAYALTGLQAIKDSLRECYNNGKDIESRTGMSLAALTSGICIANAGLGVVHGFASSIGGLYNIPHGVVCGTLMAAANEINVRELRKLPKSKAMLKKYASLGKIFVEPKGKRDDYYIDGFIQYLYQLTIDFQLPGLKKLGIPEKDIVRIAEQTDIKNNPVVLDRDCLREILEIRL